MYKFVQLIFLILLSTGAVSGELVKDTEITKISSSNDGLTDNFWIHVSGGQGLCSNQNIVFPAASSPSPEFHNRMMSLAIAAFTTGNNKVRVYNPVDDDCNKASFIELSK